MISLPGSQEDHIHGIFFLPVVSKKHATKKALPLGHRTGCASCLAVEESLSPGILGHIPVHHLMEEEGALHVPGSTLGPYRHCLLSRFQSLKCFFMQVAHERGWPEKLLLFLGCCSYSGPWSASVSGRETCYRLCQIHQQLLQKGPISGASTDQCQYCVVFPAGQLMQVLKELGS